LITPYASSETAGSSNAATDKKRFNKVHSSTRMTIERTFGILVSRWRFLGKHVYIKKIEDICNIIAACCILHNICINMGDPDFEVESYTADYDSDNNSSSNLEYDDSQNYTSGRHTRDLLNQWWSDQQNRER
jgi:hypothetical protein